MARVKKATNRQKNGKSVEKIKKKHNANGCYKG